MPIRLLLLLGLAWLIWTIWRQWSNRPRPPAAGSQHYEPTARCQQCGAYLPASSLSRSGRCGRCSE